MIDEAAARDRAHDKKSGVQIAGVRPRWGQEKVGQQIATSQLQAKLAFDEAQPLARAEPAIGPQTLLQIRLFRPLPEAALAQVAAAVRPRRLRKGDVLSLDDQLPHRMFFVLSGRFRLTVIPQSGTMITVNQFEPGDHFGELWIYAQTSPGNFQLIADSNGVLLEMQARDQMRLAATVPEISFGLMRSIANIAAGYAARIYEFALLDVSGRLSAELLRLAQLDGTADRIVINPAPTHAAIASQIGSTREGVTRNLRGLAMKGLIRTERGRIEVLSVSRLRKEVESDLGR